MNRTVILRCHTEVAEEPKSDTKQQNGTQVSWKTRGNQRRWPPFALSLIARQDSTKGSL